MKKMERSRMPINCYRRKETNRYRDKERRFKWSQEMVETEGDKLVLEADTDDTGS